MAGSLQGLRHWFLGLAPPRRLRLQRRRHHRRRRRRRWSAAKPALR